MYKPHYLNVERKKTTVYAGGKPYWSKTELLQLGYKKKPPEKSEDKSGRRFK
ncbi:hypothetical protein [Enterococcus sp. JM9B]|uniref:hypothetical protein n=1 Tax=Enterococcus sp. JM9B TaxID=1857216 RepID=UPI00192A3693|nr:hypothetical protein [Enterococcus sp. JM9B]